MSGIKQIGARLSDILEMFSYFNIIPAVVPLIIFGTDKWELSGYFLLQGVLMWILAFLLRKICGEEKESDFHLNVIAIFIAWLLIPLLSCIVYYIDGLPPLDAYFESVSAWTTTGLTMYSNLDMAAPHILFWRSFQQWMGGLGIVAFIFFLIDKNSNLVAFSKTEGREEFIRPTIRSSLKEIIKIYSIYTFIGVALLSFTGLDFFHGISIIMSAISTGGFAPYQEWMLNEIQSGIVMLFMLAGATSFLFHHRIFEGKWEIIKRYAPLQAIIALSIISFGVGVYSGLDPFNSLFHAVSAATTTGFSKITIDAGMGLYFYALLILMMIGGGLGSTAGAIKIDRIIIFIKGIKLKIRKALHPPDAVVIERYMNQTIKDEHIIHASVVIILYLLLFTLASVAVSIETGDMNTAMFEVSSALGNVGLTAGLVGPSMSSAFKALFIFIMVVGRLEVLTFLIFIGSLTRLFR
ncbi:TrkH family potassium uptake protein [Candidatus Micrarchaeota archaeon]|nr:TrkH family potassium uptake protein [Candidatus Micrarchaeota archaeon]